MGVLQSNAEFGHDPKNLEAEMDVGLGTGSHLGSGQRAEADLLQGGPSARALESLVKSAEDELRRRRMRARFLPSEFFGEGAWSMLLDLFVSEYYGRKVSTTSVCIASDVPATTALRWLDILESSGFVERLPTHHDKRVKYVSLTAKARGSLCTLLSRQATDLR